MVFIMSRVAGASMVLGSLLSVADAQIQGMKTNKIWGAVVVQTFGERVPLLSPDYSVLTPYGAQQMYDAGQYYRQRYINPPQGATGIQNITKYQINPTQLVVATDGNAWTQSSAQAFVAGLYPPSVTPDDGWQNRTTNKLANGTLVFGPLNGTQYAMIQSPTANDARSIWMQGSAQCPTWESSVSQWLQSNATTTTNSSTLWFYQQLADVFSTAPGTELDYSNAYGIWEYLNYMIIHNKTVATAHSKDLTQARGLADSYTTATLTNTSSSMNTIAGRTLSYVILDSLLSNADSSGAQTKLTTLFTSYEPFMSFAALLNLTDNYAEFAKLPNMGASFTVELYSQVETNSSAVPFPSSEEDLFVRIVWRNGTDSTAEPTLYPLMTISKDNSNGGVMYSQFVKALSSWLVASPSDWCKMCGSAATFCPYYTGQSVPGTAPTDKGHSNNQLSPVIAGVIGAMVTLGILALLLVASMLLLGIRFRRDSPSCIGKKEKAYDPSSPTSRRSRSSGLGGFKGDEKLASDIDLPKGALVAGQQPPVHQRTASWEMKNTSRQTPMVDEPAISPANGISLARREDDEEDLTFMKAVETRENV